MHRMIQRSVSAADATFVGLAEELEKNVITLDKRFKSASSRAVVLL